MKWKKDNKLKSMSMAAAGGGGYRPWYPVPAALITSTKKKELKKTTKIVMSKKVQRLVDGQTAGQGTPHTAPLYVQHQSHYIP